MEGAAECKICTAGSYVTFVNSDANGFGTGSGGEACILCPPGRESTVTGSTSCEACAAGTSSEEGEPCISCAAGSFAEVEGQSCRPWLVFL